MFVAWSVRVCAGGVFVRVGTSSLTSSQTKIENETFLAIFQLFSLGFYFDLSLCVFCR